MMPEPLTNEEIATEAAAMMAEGGPFATVPMTIRGVDYPHVFAMSQASLRDVLALRGMQYKDREFIVYDDERYTVGETWAKAMRFANWLKEEKGIGQGDRVAIAMRNYPEWPMAFLGIVASGATVVPLNAWWQEGELRDGIGRAKAKVVVCDGKRFGYLEPRREELGLTLVTAREDVPGGDIRFDDIIADEKWPQTAPSVQIDPESHFCLLYTSGSTGKPKGALLTHRSCVNAVLSWSFLLTLAQRRRPDVPFVPENPAVLLALPLFHVTALHSTLMLSWLLGRKTVFMYRWDAEKAIDLIKKEDITNFVGVPTMAHELVQAAKPGDLDDLADIITGGAKRPASQVLQQVDKFPQIGISSGYGLTETNSLVAHITMGDFINHPGSAGRAIPPINQIEVLNEKGEVQPRGTEGEICVKSPVTFHHYLEDEAATERAFYPGGWFRTGDIGVLDEEGFITILDRAKDLIIRGGENISCLEVENALVDFGPVDEAAVFSVPDEIYGEIVGAAVYGKEGPVDLQALRDHVASKLAPFKVPERLWLSPVPLPRGTTGKVDKRQIKMIATQHPAHWSAADA
ncbi:class I adenylate-forming enzyme family protein [Parvularcula sp. LCG005]|uniref:class I adenylate-forming enzyme family protein n=1 Tax=Parvularcula sp. LCG005 TaxID=3078805 RepID=UPI0029431E3F|nr:class I adenylate-forming enzyme family protein [Parvularcula sp. LCG005]WOI52967.1 class I adenylate-forming enzyme family protein [Parvularcula sp. LCG005]